MGTPHQPLTWEIELTAKGTVHMGMVTHHHTGFLGYVLLPFYRNFGINNTQYPTQNLKTCFGEFA